MENYSLSDLAAVTREGSENTFGGNGAWWIIILFLFVFMGGGFFGNRQGEFGQYATAASQQEILFGQQFNQLNERLTNIGNGICDSTFAINNSLVSEGRAMQTQLSDYYCKNQLAAANLAAQMNQNTCDIAAAIHADGEATRQLIQTNEIQSLRDKVSALEMDNRMYGVVRYPNGYTYSAGASPFCGGGCCGNNI